MRKKRKRKKCIDKTDIFEYATLLVQFSPRTRFETSYRLWSGYLNETYPETEPRFLIQKCCSDSDCRKAVVTFKVDPQPLGSGFNLQYSASKTASTELGPNVVGDLTFERAFPDAYKCLCPEARDLKILSIAECSELCERFVRTVHYTRAIFEVEQLSSSFLLMQGDPIFLKWLKALNTEISEMTAAERAERIACMKTLLSEVRKKYEN